MLEFSTDQLTAPYEEPPHGFSNFLHEFNTKSETAKSSSPETGSVPLVTARVEDTGIWFISNSSKYDGNKDGLLQKEEIAAGLSAVQQSNPGSNDDFYLQLLLDANKPFASGNDEEWGFDESISKQDIVNFSKWVNLYDQDLQKLKEISPSKYQAINFVRQNLTEVDTDQNGAIDLSELQQYSARTDLSEDLKVGADALQKYIYPINDLDKSWKTLLIDQALGIEPSVGYSKAERYMSHETPSDLSFELVLEDRRAVANTVIDYLKHDRESAAFGVFWGTPE